MQGHPARLVILISSRPPRPHQISWRLTVWETWVTAAWGGSSVSTTGGGKPCKPLNWTSPIVTGDRRNLQQILQSDVQNPTGQDIHQALNKESKRRPDPRRSSKQYTNPRLQRSNALGLPPCFPSHPPPASHSCRVRGSRYSASDQNVPRTASTGRVPQRRPAVEGNRFHLYTQ